MAPQDQFSAAASSSIPSNTASDDSSTSSAAPSSAPSNVPLDNSSEDSAGVSSLLSSLGIDQATLTASGTPYTTLTISSGLATPTTVVLDKNQTQALEQAQTCYQQDSVPIIIQNATLL
jgi:hypothetical protein